MRLVKQQLRSDTGWVFRNSTANIYLSDGSTLATLFFGDGSPYANPVVTTSDGYVEFYVLDGVLSLTYSVVEGFATYPVRPLPVGVVTVSQSTDNIFTTGIASESILLGHAVSVDASGGLVLCDSGNQALSGTCIGVANGSASAGQNVQVICSGIFYRGAYTMSSGDIVFIGPNGALTQTPPSSGFSQQVGVAISATKILVSIESAIDLA
jgi:predicted RecA/RadA family phage recombinase